MESFRIIGERLRAQRLAAKMSAEEVATAIGVSRALLHRYESGNIVKLDTMERLARVYGLSPTALMGLGTEYLTDGIKFFERIQKLEEEADQITVVFGPLVYVLSSDRYDQALARSLASAASSAISAIAATSASASSEVNIAARDDDALLPMESAHLLQVLTRRKAVFRYRQPSMIHILPMDDIERYLMRGLAGRHEKRYTERAQLRLEAIREMEHTAELIASPPMGLQIALTPRELPSSGFQIIRSGARRLLVNSPFRLGEPLNLRYGVATITEDGEAVKKHEQLAERLWKSALKGAEAATQLKRLIMTYRDM